MSQAPNAEQKTPAMVENWAAKPLGILPKNTQAMVIAGIAVVMVGAIAFSGPRGRQWVLPRGPRGRKRYRERPQTTGLFIAFRIEPCAQLPQRQSSLHSPKPCTECQHRGPAARFDFAQCYAIRNVRSIWHFAIRRRIGSPAEQLANEPARRAQRYGDERPRSIRRPQSIRRQAVSPVRRNGSRGGTDESTEWLVRRSCELHADHKCLLARWPATADSAG